MSTTTAEPMEVAEHFADAEQQTHAWRFGMWVFLGSESLLFAGLFALYAAYRFLHPQDFAHAIAHNNKLLGSLNTVVLITSSFTAALAVHAAEHKRVRATRLLLGATLLLATWFLVNKGIEYGEHIREGLVPGSKMFYSLYFGTTGLHALHVIIGMVVLGVLMKRQGSAKATAVGVELGVLYWHLVDLIWIFLWPLYYLTGHAS
jgi:cytochrome c oxidase subunit III